MAAEILLVFVKLPRPGEVKTRLARTIGREAAAGLYAAFVEDVLKTAARSGFAHRVMYSPKEEDRAVREWLGGRDIAPQSGADLGFRMRNALAEAFRKGASRAALIGSDCPDLPATAVAETFAALKKNDAVIGPAQDGGYYLIGFSKNGFAPEVFDGPRWGTGTVLETTLKLLEKAGKSVHLLSTRRDVDTADDLAALVERARGSAFEKSRTMSFLAETAK